MVTAASATAPGRASYASGRVSGGTEAYQVPFDVKLVIILFLSSFTVLARFAINLGFYSVEFSFIALYAAVAIFLYRGYIQFKIDIFLFYVFFALWGVVTFLFSVERVSVMSFILLFFMFLPFCFKWKQGEHTEALWRTTLGLFVSVCAFVGVAGVLQFFAQFAIHSQWVIDFTPNIPDPIRGGGVYNTAIPVGSFFKSNGFFLREPSSFSQFMALALIAEWLLFRRLWMLGLFLFCLLVSYSGTGLICIGVALLFPLGLKTVVRVGLVALAGLLVYFVLGDALNLSFIVNRIGEFGSTNSSAGQRFVGPLLTIIDQFSSTDTVWSAFVGNGPGAGARMAFQYEVAGSTWIRLMLDYGLIGTVLFLTFFLRVINQYPSPVELRVAIFVFWFITGDGLLTASAPAIVFILAGLWPALEAKRAGRPSDHGPVNPRPLKPLPLEPVSAVRAARPPNGVYKR